MRDQDRQRFDEAQFELQFRTHFVPLSRYALQYTQDMDTAKEVVQKVFVALWEAREKIDPTQSVKSYLYRAVRSRCLNYIRDNKKFRSKVLDLDCGDMDLMVEQEEIADDDIRQKVDKALDQLPEKCRQVFKMSRFQGMKYREIAEELGVSQKTVEAHISKAIKILRSELKDYLHFVMICLIYF